MIESLFALLLLLSDHAHADVQPFWQLPTNKLSQICQQVIQQSVKCDESLLWAGVNGRLEADETLAKLCSSTCLASLRTYHRRVSGACEKNTLLLDDGAEVTAEFFPISLLDNFNLMCLKNDRGDFCHALLMDINGVNPGTQEKSQKVTDSDKVAQCDECVLRNLGLRVGGDAPSLFDEKLIAVYEELAEKCGKKAVVASKDPGWLVSRAQRRKRTCDGFEYTIREGEDCHNIAKWQRMSITNLLSVNGLRAGCCDFPKSGTRLCIDKQCDVYAVKAGDTCNSIANAFKTSFARIVSWNRDIDLWCSNLGALVGNEICVSNPGGTWTTSEVQGSELADKRPLGITETSKLTAMANIPSATFADREMVEEDLPMPQGTRTDCFEYRVGKTTISCLEFASEHEVEIRDFLKWNGGLPREPEGCKIQLSVKYCVSLLQKAPSGAPRKITKATPNSCNKFAIALKGKTCQEFVKENGLDMKQFLAWNTGLGSQCENFKGGQTYCVGVKGYRQPGIAPNCNKFEVGRSYPGALTPRDVCENVEAKHGLQHERFVAWNPALGMDCSGMVDGYEYCVGIPTFKQKLAMDPMSLLTGQYGTKWAMPVLTVPNDPMIGVGDSWL